MSTLQPMAEPLWRDVSLAELEAFLRAYPRPLEARPPLTRKAYYGERLDAAVSEAPSIEVRDLFLRPSRQCPPPARISMP